jgi:hypothetical protein
MLGSIRHHYRQVQDKNVGPCAMATGFQSVHLGQFHVRRADGTAALLQEG